jgi:hypothetical protein
VSATWDDEKQMSEPTALGFADRRQLGADGQRARRLQQHAVRNGERARRRAAHEDKPAAIRFGKSVTRFARPNLTSENS